VLSIFLISCTMVATGMMLKNHLGKVMFGFLFFALLFPTTINETKATVVLLPLGLLTVAVAGSPPGKRIKVLTVAVVMLASFAAILIPVYDAMEQYNPHKNEQHLVDFFSNSENTQSYLESRHVGVGTEAPVRRGDAIKVPLQYLSRDPVHMVFGLGLGNASHSNLGENFTGNYYGLFKSFGILSVSVFMLEIGLLGTALVFVLYLLIFLDANAVARKDDSLIGGLAVGWIGVTVVLGIATFYTAIHLFPSLSYMYWYFAGHVAARRMVLAREESQARGRAPRPIAPAARLDSSLARKSSRGA
jgi:cell division protein FtsW (lipid II flippase)